MDNRTMTRTHIGEALHQSIGLSRAESAALAENVLTAIADALAAGHNVKLSSFGTFVLRHKNERIGRNPKTGVEVPIAPRTVLTFRASGMLRDRVNATPK